MLSLKSITLNSCKFLTNDAFEQFWFGLAETENSLVKVEINRINKHCSAKGFEEFLRS